MKGWMWLVLAGVFIVLFTWNLYWLGVIAGGILGSPRSH
jgi:hypothetical protein